MQTLEHISGVRSVFIVTVRDSDGEPITGFSSADVPSVAIWSGDDQGVLASPAAEWYNGRPQDGEIRITISADDVAALPPAVYRLIGFITRNGVRDAFVQAYLRIYPSPGSGAPLKAYGSYQDLTVHVANLDDLQADTSQAGLMEEREMASRWLDEIILSRAHGQGDRQWLAARLAAGGLDVDTRVREIVALRALSTAIQGRLSGKNGPEDPLPALGRTFARRASSAVASLVVRVAGDSAGTWHREINLSEVPTYRG